MRLGTAQYAKGEIHGLIALRRVHFVSRGLQETPEYVSDGIFHLPVPRTKHTASMTG